MGNKILKKCRICSSTKLEAYIDLGKQPFSNSFLQYKDIKKEKKFPLIVALCKSCGLSQLSIVPDTKLIFGEYDYLSSSSKALSKHYKKLVIGIIKKYKILSTDYVLDIGCNDGVLLEHYPKNFLNIIGVEPSDASEHIKERRIKLLKSFFNYKASLKYLKKYKKPKIITITNVLAQIDDINEFAKGLQNIIKNESIIIIEFPYLLHMINDTIFDIIYHEHLSYFSLTPLKLLFERYGIKIFNFEKINFGASGPAVRLFLAKNNSNYKVTNKLRKQLMLEKKWGIKKIKKYKLFSNNTKIKLKKIKDIIYKKYDQGFKIGCFTASAKGNTLLNSLNLRKNIIRFTSENNIKKIKKYTPGAHIKIVSDKQFLKKNIDYALLVSWNYKKFFLSRSAFIKKGGKFIIPFPNPHIK